ncbi:hypothetical protein TNCV_451861 [Trichonephila clavipes]|nr:hypothetical protein TNCV_451861 [Trichonephila clavipes]
MILILLRQEEGDKIFSNLLVGTHSLRTSPLFLSRTWFQEESNPLNKGLPSGQEGRFITRKRYLQLAIHLTFSLDPLGDGIRIIHL